MNRLFLLLFLSHTLHPARLRDAPFVRCASKLSPEVFPRLTFSLLFKILYLLIFTRSILSSLPLYPSSQYAAPEEGRATSPGGDGELGLDFDSAVQQLVEEEEHLLDRHMGAIQRDAALLTEEGDLLARVQGDDIVNYDIDAYVTRLETVRCTPCARLPAHNIARSLRVVPLPPPFCIFL